MSQSNQNSNRQQSQSNESAKENENQNNVQNSQSQSQQNGQSNNHDSQNQQQQQQGQRQEQQQIQDDGYEHGQQNNRHANQNQDQEYEAEAEEEFQEENGDQEHKFHEEDDNRRGKKAIRKRPTIKMNNDQGELLPFIVQSFNKQQRQRERANKPKLGLKRLTQDKKLVSVDIDIPIDENTVIKDKFDWDLTKDKISPSDFSKQLVMSLKLPLQYSERIKQQILSQIMQHIKANTCQKQQQRETFMNEQQANFNRGNMRFNYTQYPEDDLLQKQQNEKKKMSRMRRIQMKRTTAYLPAQPNRYFKEKKMCRNCKNQNNAPGYQCKNCKLPFELMEMLDFDNKRVKISAKYYEKIANKIPLLVYQAKKKNFEKEDFDSFYAIYNKIRGIFEQSDQLSKQNLNQVKYIMEKYHEYFLNGNLDFNDEDIIYDKDMKKGDKKQEDNKPKRARGRPRKIKIINDDLVPNSNQNSQEESSESSESSLSDSSS